MIFSASPKPHPSKPRPCNMPQAKTEVALQFSECCAAETALQHWLFCNAEVIWTKNCAAAKTKNCTATSKKLRCRKVALSCRFPCGFQAPTFRHPRFGPADFHLPLHSRSFFSRINWGGPRAPDNCSRKDISSLDALKSCNRGRLLQD